ncbi:(Fe-S)-binding protein [Clostridium zeae]|uniref:(Fe-S)-binding protein n=1 Tax=Clostridium zeae TaxID=2759022 RepID=A0ABQ1E8I0_9CLOT|nr:(Fe-S)-binding protein [Clostridium zeae]GFZ31092.1 (Fe-S)-binding protein [Clostridium zeae]
MKEVIKNKITNYILSSEDNWNIETDDRIFDEPIIKFASADDPLFEQYKTIIGEEHFTPREIYEKAFGEDSYHGGTVIGIVLPINEKIRMANRKEKQWASKEWSHIPDFDMKELYKYIISMLSEMGYKTIVPEDSEWFKKLISDKVGPSSNWSVRHAAYAAGLGTFSLNDGFISEKGTAIRLLSVLTELKLEPDVREATNHLENCVYFNKGICGACIKRCPANALSKNGHDKIKCYQRAYVEAPNKIGVSQCSLCQTNVPCEYKNPIR